MRSGCPLRYFLSRHSPCALEPDCCSFVRRPMGSARPPGTGAVSQETREDRGSHPDVPGAGGCSPEHARQPAQHGLGRRALGVRERGSASRSAGPDPARYPSGAGTGPGERCRLHSLPRGRHRIQPAPAAQPHQLVTVASCLCGDAVLRDSLPSAWRIGRGGTTRRERLGARGPRELRESGARAVASYGPVRGGALVRGGAGGGRQVGTAGGPPRPGAGTHTRPRWSNTSVARARGAGSSCRPRTSRPFGRRGRGSSSIRGS